MSDSPARDGSANWRPRFHFTAPRGWINDPNGLVRHGGAWHLHYQYLGDKHWGHATSRDLFNWEHLPVALAPDKNGQCWSGGTVDDARNTSGVFKAGTGGLVSIYTSRDETVGQRISLAFSADGGMTWRNHPGNPVLKGSTPQFRDPKVFWHPAGRRWVMVLTEDYHFTFFASANLRDWRETGRFIPSRGPEVDGFDCPDLFELPVENQPGQSKWVLTASCVNGAAFAGEFGFGLCAQQYFVGEFDGATFTAQTGMQRPVPLGAGPDEYASIVWPRETDGERRTILIGWMNHWGYAKKIPTGSWQGCLTLPRELRLQETGPGDWQLRQAPARELWAQPHETIDFPGRKLTAGEPPQRLGKLHCGAILATFRPGENSIIEFELFAGSEARTIVGYDSARKVLYFDRRKSGSPEFHPNFHTRHETGMTLTDDGVLDLLIIIDHSTVEIFGGEGAVYLSGLVFPDVAADEAGLKAVVGSVGAEKLQLRKFRE